MSSVYQLFLAITALALGSCLCEPTESTSSIIVTLEALLADKRGLLNATQSILANLTESLEKYHAGTGYLSCLALPCDDENIQLLMSEKSKANLAMAVDSAEADIDLLQWKLLNLKVKQAKGPSDGPRVNLTALQDAVKLARGKLTIRRHQQLGLAIGYGPSPAGGDFGGSKVEARAAAGALDPLASADSDDSQFGNFLKLEKDQDDFGLLSDDEAGREDKMTKLIWKWTLILGALGAALGVILVCVTCKSVKEIDDEEGVIEDVFWA